MKFWFHIYGTKNRNENMTSFPFHMKISIRNWLMTAIAILLLISSSFNVFAYTTVVIGDPKIIQPHIFSFENMDKNIVLYVLSSVDKKDTCIDKKTGESWKCGEEAVKTVESLVDNADVMCIMKKTNIFPFGMYVCKNWEGKDIGLEMLRRGLAFLASLNDIPEEYVQAEEEARQNERGIWRSTLGDNILLYRQKSRVILKPVWKMKNND